ncbi:phytoene desaturase family protein [Agromyces bracchium]|uniref:FAD-dependent oxidoreductase n=1 Tax=Agromyces bracchium TaxID=88376 RepID=A0A6I3M6R1_9MICO|nr:NAD(P)/FAD-dependent oxidoreductase [Agromyces bracchium]MTH67852.1 FAD-dependent oxidoreductase [Agromyces bracchium]
MPTDAHPADAPPPAGAPDQAPDHDVVIVGGGHNGLTAAAYLARAGKRVLLLERDDHLGGAAVSAEAFEGVDARLSRYSYLVSLLPQRIIDDLGLDVRLVRRRFSSYTPDPRDPSRGLLVDVEADAAAARDAFARVGAEGDADAWEAFYADTARVAEALFPTLTEPLPTRAEARALVGDDRVWDGFVERPLGEAIDERFADDLVRGIVATDGLIGTFTDLDDPSLDANRCFLYHVIGGGTGDWDVPVGGMGAVSGELARAAREAGAVLRTEAEVVAIDPATGEVRWREGGLDAGSDGGERAVRAHVVLANVAPVVLERLVAASGRGTEAAPADAGTGPAASAAPASGAATVAPRDEPAAVPGSDEVALDDATRRRLARAGMPEGAQVKVNLLLTRLPRLADASVAPEQAFAGTFHINELESQLEAAYRSAAAGDLPDPLPCEIYCHTLSDRTILGPELAASDAQTLTVFGLHVPDRLVDAHGNDELRERLRDAVLASLDSVLAEPIADVIATDAAGRLCVEVKTTRDLEDALNMPGGNIFHGPLSWPWTEPGAEPATPAERWGVATSHPRVLVCGSGAVRGGAVSGIGGHNAAMAVLEEELP